MPDFGKSKPGTSPENAIDSKSLNRIWKDDHFRLFLSHKAAHKEETAALKAKLALYGIDCFVAHEDIHPTEEWQAEIENALFSIDGFAALMTEDFHDSYWTDQEVGVAFARQVPMIAIDLGQVPYGFIGKFQALRCKWEEAPKRILKLLIHENKMKDAYIQAVLTCDSFDYGNKLAEALPDIDKLTAVQIESLIKAYNENGQVNGSHGFNGGRPRHYGPGLASELSRITGEKYLIDRHGIKKDLPF